MTAQPRALDRLQSLLNAARRIADASDPLGVEARRLLPDSTGLSAEGVELALQCSLEYRATRAELRALASVAVPVPRAHVLLSANVFVAALRAIALAVAASSDVYVRASRRDPIMARLLNQGAPGVFQLVDALAPFPGDHLWAYGTAETLASLRAELPGGVFLHGHGPGFGAVIVQQRPRGESSSDALSGLARDVALFDQRGCLSPRLVVLVGEAAWADEWIRRAVGELAAVQHAVPRGYLSPEEASDVTRFRDTASYAMETFPAGKGWVSYDPDGRLLLLPPAGRCLHVMRAPDARSVLEPIATELTALALEPFDNLEQAFALAFPQARLTRVGLMQQPALDGPVDRRPSRAGHMT